ncbi:MAG TPA: RraA family protein [Chthoniobacteraceae bacterium]|nr:RraA family protein [Chthoniobacteraceae bacterium]
MNYIIGSETLGALAALETTAVANAIETFDVRLRNEGFADCSLHCRFPQLPPMVGYAVTMRIKASSPPAKGHTYLDRTDWWAKLDSLLLPHVMVIQDMDDRPGRGAFVGEVHAAILKALGCAGVVTNGAVRDLPGIEKTGFQLFSGSIAVSHAYAHLVEFGGPVEVAGLKIKPGDLLHGDQHGLLRIPLEIAEAIPKVAAGLRKREKIITAYCKSKEFSPSGLAKVIEQSAPDATNPPTS